MCGPCICSRVPYTHEVLAASMNKQRNWSIRLLTNDAEILAFWIDWPPLHLRKSMRCGKTHGVLNLRIVPNLDGGIVPPIETMAYIASIAQRNVLFEDGGTGRQSQFDRPFHSINPVDIPYCDSCAAILVACIGEIYRPPGNRIVGNRTVHRINMALAARTFASSVSSSLAGLRLMPTSKLIQLKEFRSDAIHEDV